MNSCHVSLTHPEENSDLVTGLTIFRPCIDLRLWNSLYEILRLGDWVLFFPAEKPPIIVSDRKRAAHLPADMRESLGPIREVHSGSEIAEIVRTS